MNGRADCTGPAVQLGAEEKYFPTCFPCYRSSLKSSGQALVNWEDMLNGVSADSDESTELDESDELEDSR